MELFAWEIERVFPENESGAETTAVATDAPLPVRIPESEVEPVPPPATVSVPESDGAKVSVFPAPVIVIAEVRPFVVFEEDAIVTAGPVWSWPAGPMEKLLIDEVATHCG